MPPQICLARGSSCDQKQNLDWFCSPSFIAPPSFLASLSFGSSWAEVGIRWALGCSYSTQKGARILIFFFFFWDLGLLSAILIAQFFIMQDKALWAPGPAASLTTSHLSNASCHPPAIVQTGIPVCVTWLCPCPGYPAYLIFSPGPLAKCLTYFQTWVLTVGH